MFREQVTEVNKNKILNSNSITVNRNPNLDNYLSSKNYVVDSIGEYTIVRIIQTSQNYLKVSVGNDKYNLTKYDETQIIDTTINKNPNTGGDLLQNWILKCNDKNNSGEIQNFIMSKKIQTAQPVIQEQRVYLLSVEVFWNLRHHLIIIVKLFLSASIEKILFKSLV